ncbi:4-alpha-glucanotransferase [Myxococcota bacterium]|nr:4-alpha-glucanotransferase [Myxococcota bacterium]
MTPPVTILDRRASGLLLHPTSLPSPHGIGDLGQEARDFADVLAASRQTWWQMLPITPPSYKDSPYTSQSAFASSPWLIDLRGLVEDGLLDPADAREAEVPVTASIDFGRVMWAKGNALQKAYRRAAASSTARADLAAFAEAEKSWLDDYAMYAALHRAHGQRAWTEWPAELRDRHPDALERAKQELAEGIDFTRFVEWVFDRQWRALRRDVAKRGILLMGDLPIFVAMDSAEVWANREIFLLDERGLPKVVAGVPPDYFSEDGQLWGNPLYDWEVLRDRNYDWWIARLKRLFARFDAVRIDHFIGFYRAWHVPATAKTAREGEYVAGPRAHFFERVQEALGPVPIVAEDLGVVIPEIRAMREQLGFPGMRVLQFGFGDVEKGNEHLPHSYVPRSVAYTGTHDNDTINGWYRALEAKVREGGRDAASAAAQLDHIHRYLAGVPHHAHWAMIRLVMMSAANLTLFPVQDLLGLGAESRMNTPGRADDNWSWRLLPNQLDAETIRIFRELTTLFGRARDRVDPAT